VLTYPDGSKYDGHWSAGYFDGRGIWSSPDGSSYEGEWSRGLANGKGVRRTALGNVFHGTFVGGCPSDGAWTSPTGVKTPFVVGPSARAKSLRHLAGHGGGQPSVSEVLLAFVLDAYLHVVIGYGVVHLLARRTPFGATSALIISVPVALLAIRMEQMHSGLKQKLLQSHYYERARLGNEARKLFEPLQFDNSLLQQIAWKARLDEVDIGYEWLNHIFAQFWSTYGEWLDRYIRMQIELAVCGLGFIRLHTCTLGKSPITVSALRSSGRNDDPRLRAARARNATTNDEDLIVDLFVDLDWQSDIHIRLVLFGFVPISVQFVRLHASTRVVIQWKPLDYRDTAQFPNLAYLGLESLGPVDLGLSLKIFDCIDLFSIPPLGSLFGHDKLLDIVYDLLGPETGFWLDFVRGRAIHPFPIIDDRAKCAEETIRLRKLVGDAKGLRDTISDSKLQITVTVMASHNHEDCTPFCKLHVGTKTAKVDQFEKTSNGRAGSSSGWPSETFSWLCSPKPDEASESYLCVKLMRKDLRGEHQIGVFEAPLSELVFRYDLVPNAGPRRIVCEIKSDRPSSTYSPILELEICLYSLGLPEVGPQCGPADGTPLNLCLENLGAVSGILHVQFRDCINLHPQMNKKLNKATKLKPYVKLLVGAKRDFEAFFGKSNAHSQHSKLLDGILGNSTVGEDDECHIFRVKTTKEAVHESGQPVSWSEADASFMFDTETPARDGCLLVQVRNDDETLGQTLIEFRELSYDLAANRFALSGDKMLRLLLNEDMQAVPIEGSPVHRNLLETSLPEAHSVVGEGSETPGQFQGRESDSVSDKTVADDLVKRGFPLATMFVSFLPKTYQRSALIVAVVKASKLPRMDFFSRKADPFVIVSLSTAPPELDLKYETDVVERSLDPVWTRNNVFTIYLDNPSVVDPSPAGWMARNLKIEVMDFESSGQPRQIGAWKRTLGEVYRTISKDIPAGGGSVDVDLSLDRDGTRVSGTCTVTFTFVGSLWSLV